MNALIQVLVSGVAMGFIYALAAVEYTLIWNSCRLLNFSHVQMIMYSAFIFGGTFANGLHFPFWLGAICTILIMTVIGAVMANLILIPLRSLSRLFAIIATMMLGRMFIESTTFIWTALPFTVKSYLTGVVKIFSATTAAANIYIIIVATIVIILLLLFMKKTKLGKAMRCVAENRNAASYMGINIHFNMTLTITISVVICAIIGLMIIPLYGVRTTMADTIGLKGFAAGVVGCFGSVPGAILGGIIIGILENAACIFVPAVYKDVVAYVIVIAFLMFKPNGLLGKRGAKI